MISPPNDSGGILELYLRSFHSHDGDPASKFALLDALASEVALTAQREKILLAFMALECERLTSEDNVEPKKLITHLQNHTPLTRGKTFIYDLIKKAPEAATLITEVLDREQVLLAQAVANPHTGIAYRLIAQIRLAQLRDAARRFVGRFTRIPITVLTPLGLGAILGGQTAATSGGVTGAAAAGTPAAASATAGVSVAAGATGLGAATATVTTAAAGAPTMLGIAGSTIAHVASAAGLTMGQAATALAATGLVATAPVMLVGDGSPRDPAPIVMTADTAATTTPDTPTQTILGMPDTTPPATPSATLAALDTAAAPAISPTVSPISSLTASPHITSPPRRPRSTPTRAATTTAATMSASATKETATSVATTSPTAKTPAITPTATAEPSHAAEPSSSPLNPTPTPAPTLPPIVEPTPNLTPTPQEPTPTDTQTHTAIPPTSTPTVTPTLPGMPEPAVPVDFGPPPDMGPLLNGDSFGSSAAVTITPPLPPPATGWWF
ncbi:hypothetical protein [Nonomuraea glycinis]|uniref:hypothetical protein n=1 Tax=Nonomuraea glycinis TaxID=2047744 RepID=UPI0033B31116